jgi:hypothetical protein
MRTVWWENCSRYGAVMRGVASDMVAGWDSNRSLWEGDLLLRVWFCGYVARVRVGRREDV